MASKLFGSLGKQSFTSRSLLFRTRQQKSTFLPFTCFSTAELGSSLNLQHVSSSSPYPSGYTQLPNDPDFNDDTHLNLLPPEKIVRLSELGDSLGTPSTDFGLCTPFRVLSDVGIDKFNVALHSLLRFAQSSPRIPR